MAQLEQAFLKEAGQRAYLYGYYKAFRDGATDPDDVARWSGMAERHGRDVDLLMDIGRNGLTAETWSHLVTRINNGMDTGKDAAVKAGANMNGKVK